MIGGVCCGLGNYFGIDPTIVRLFFVLLAVTNSIGVLIYILLWIIIPREDRSRDVTLADAARTGADEIAEQARSLGDELRNAVNNPHPQTSLYIGLALILLGGFYLLQNLRLPWLLWLDTNLLWPALLILAGLALLFRRWRGD
jgi:phage shock protein C